MSPGIWLSCNPYPYRSNILCLFSLEVLMINTFYCFRTIPPEQQAEFKALSSDIQDLQQNISQEYHAKDVSNQRSPSPRSMDVLQEPPPPGLALCQKKHDWSQIGSKGPVTAAPCHVISWSNVNRLGSPFLIHCLHEERSGNNKQGCRHTELKAENQPGQEGSKSFQ